ncbi:uncharacterized protein LOC111799805 [Cucurbita pepo subsp. pepo]|uniref:uncharacterized protein LOC111799805 n=1 Tax=Cucurbita pepo subsp. pepo TaxID=3664 RepID=UPI000C9D84F5|nr:uncharacterized protein LOC111799805 [Cucurbita pepo subsp. pepo]
MDSDGVDSESAPARSTGLTIKIAPSSATKPPGTFPSDLALPDLKTSIESSPYNSPSLLSPPSSAFVSALQSPYISPRAVIPKTEANPIPTDITTALTCSSPPISHSEDIPSSSYTPPSDQYEYSDNPSTDSKLQFVACVPVPDSAPPRISFSFPVPRISFAKCGGPLSPVSTSKLRSCDVYIGFHGQANGLIRFCKWLKSELELQGIACFIADRSKYSDNQSHEIADRVISSVTFGIVVLTNSKFHNPFTLEEVRFFSQKKNLIPLFFNMESSEISSFLSYNSMDKEFKETGQGLMKFHEYKLEANEGNWRSCIAKAAGILRAKLGRMSTESDVERFEELPFPRNRNFVGREKEIMEMETALFGGRSCHKQDGVVSTPIVEGNGSQQSEGLADEESEPVTVRGSRFINLEIGRSDNPTLETWVEPAKGRNSFKRSKHKEMVKTGNHKSTSSSILCINGVPGIGKTELALEFAYRYSQRYKMVLWVGGEARYFRQNILNLSLNLGLDISADAEKDRGRFRSFEEQELEAFKRVKRELFGDMPYLLIIDNLEAEEDWWEGKDLNDLLPRNTGGSHVIITTRLSKVTSFRMINIHPLPLADAMVLMRGRRKKEYPSEELEYLRKFDEKLGRLTYGLWVIGSLLGELAITPSSLFEAIEQVPVDESSPCSYISINEEHYCKNNPFLMKIIYFSFSILEQTNGPLASGILLVGAWFAPAPVSISVLATAAKDMAVSRKGLKKWSQCLSFMFGCCSSCLASQAWKSEEESALLLIKFGLARKANKQPGCWIQFHPITQVFAKRKEGLSAAKSIVQGIRKSSSNTMANLDHLWASAFLVFGFKSEPPFVQLKAIDMVLYIKKTALPLAILAFTTFSRCNSALELLKVCTNALEEVEKSFVSQIQDWCEGSLCWKKKFQGRYQRVDEYVWQDVTLLKATLLETRAKLLLRGGHFDSAEELCRTCISIRTVMLGHNHAQTLAAQETLAKIVRLRSKI